jgi:8-oxo-dGTP pyrophosphatase MutT (NUDIX family)
MTSSDEPRPWRRLASEPGPDLRLFRQRWDTLENPRNGRALRALVLEARDWCNVVARTPDGRFVLVRQYRFGTQRVTTEVPGGVVERDEEPLAAARRELREESGYVAARWTELRPVAPNPAFLDNRCHHFLAEDARPTSAQELDPGEDIAVVTWSADEVRAAIARGELDHSLALTALAQVIDVRVALSGERA